MICRMSNNIVRFKFTNQIHSICSQYFSINSPLTELTSQALKRSTYFSVDNCCFRDVVEKKSKMADSIVAIPIQSVPDDMIKNLKIVMSKLNITSTLSPLNLFIFNVIFNGLTKRSSIN